MRLALLTAFFTTLAAALATAQAPAGNFTVPGYLKLVHMKLVPPLASPRSTLLPVLRMKVPAEPAVEAGTCAIPLLNVVPRNANPDPGMVIVRPRATPRMPQVVPPAPACDEVRRP